MSKCRYCEGDYANPFKMSYTPLWFAWRPVWVANGHGSETLAFLRRVHRRQGWGTSGNFAGTYPVSLGYTYLEHSDDQLTKGAQDEH